MGHGNQRNMLATSEHILEELHRLLWIALVLCEASGRQFDPPGGFFLVFLPGCYPSQQAAF